MAEQGLLSKEYSNEGEEGPIGYNSLPLNMLQLEDAPTQRDLPAAFTVSHSGAIGGTMGRTNSVTGMWSAMAPQGRREHGGHHLRTAAQERQEGPAHFDSGKHAFLGLPSDADLRAERLS